MPFMELFDWKEGKIEKEDEIENGLGTTQTSNGKSTGVREYSRISANMAF